MKKLYFSFLFIIISQFDLFGQTFTAGGINYKITSVSPAEVAVAPHTTFSGVANIPSTVTNASVTYNVTSIGDSSFYNCSGLTSIIIPNSVTSIGNFAFFTCSSLTSVSIPSSVLSIGSNAFFTCSALTSINIPNSVTNIGEAAFGITGLTTINIPNSIQTIANHTFFNCISLATVTIPSSVTAIGNFAFYGCGLTSVTVDWSSPLFIAPQVFEAVNLSGVTLVVPEGTTSLYQSTAVWEDFGFFSSLGITDLTNEDNYMNIYPNPAKESLTIESNEATTLRLVSVQGQQLKTIQLETQTTIDVSNLSPGIYLLIGDNNQAIRFIKE